MTKTQAEEKSTRFDGVEDLDRFRLIVKQSKCSPQSQLWASSQNVEPTSANDYQAKDLAGFFPWHVPKIIGLNLGLLTVVGVLFELLTSAEQIFALILGITLWTVFQAFINLGVGISMYCDGKPAMGWFLSMFAVALATIYWWG